MEVPELAADLGQLVAVEGMADAAGAFGAAFGVEGFAMKKGAAEDLAEVGDLSEETVQL